MQFSEEDVNAYLGNVMKHKKEKLEHPLLSFERAILGFTEGNCRMTMERSIFGYSIFTSGDYDVQVKGGKVRRYAKKRSYRTHADSSQRASVRGISI